MKSNLQKILSTCRELEGQLTDFEPKTDTHAWMIRECANLLARISGILEAMAADED